MELSGSCCLRRCWQAGVRSTASSPANGLLQLTATKGTRRGKQGEGPGPETDRHVVSAALMGELPYLVTSDKVH